VTASAWLYLTPATAAVWAWLMFDEALTVTTGAGFAVAATGVGTLLWRPASVRIAPRERSVVV
jgi:drug/metabolite transporter (DMT)-like permease